MVTPVVTASLQGLPELLQQVKRFEEKIRMKIMRRAVDRCGAIVNKEAKARCPRRPKTPQVQVIGTLRKSIGRKRKAYRNNGVYVNVVGPRRGFRVQIGVTRKGKPIYEDPVNIAHLVEFGHGGPAPAGPQSFMRSSWDGTKSECMNTMKTVMAEGIEEAAKA